MLNEEKSCKVFALLSIVTLCLGVLIGRFFPYQVAIPEPIIEYQYIIQEPVTLALDPVEVEIEEVEPEPFYPLSDAERRVVECLVEGESGNQSLKGRKLVAQCIYNACVKDNLTPSEVRRVYGYEGWSENVSDTTKEAVTAVFDNGEMETDENILWFYNPKYSRGSFHESQRHILTEEDHKFFAPWE